MKRLLSTAVTAAAILAVAATGAGATGERDDDDHRRGKAWQYAVKYLCGEIDVRDAFTSALTSANYRTAINIANANDRSTDRIVDIIPTEGPGVFTGLSILDNLNAFEGEEIDCGNIIDGGSRVLQKGFIIVQSCKRPLDITAIYQASRGAQDFGDHTLTQDVEQIVGRKLRREPEGCDDPR